VLYSSRIAHVPVVTLRLPGNIEIIVVPDIAPRTKPKALLPALDRLNLPIPLCGTSNHFRASALKWLMAWDPFNVTEDADLSMRLARAGYLCQVLDSTTYEEAPRRFMCWLRQRTRWLKGYMQTWLVHMRFPRALWRELGPRGFLAFQINDRRHRAVGAGASLVLWAAGL